MSGCQSVVGLTRNNVLERSACTTFHTGGLFSFRLLKHSLFFFYTKSLLIVNFVTLLFFVVVAHFVFFLMLSKNNKTSRYNTYLVFKLFSVNTSFNLVVNDSILFYLHVAAYMFFFLS